MKKTAFIILLGAFFISLSSAQNAQVVSETLESQTVSVSKAAYFCVTALELGTAALTEDQAFSLAVEKNLLPKDIQKDSDINYRDLSYLLSNTWNIKSSLMYSLFKNERYAFKNLKAQGIIPQAVDPAACPDGHQFMNIITSCINNFDIL